VCPSTRDASTAHSGPRRAPRWLAGRPTRGCGWCGRRSPEGVGLAVPAPPDEHAAVSATAAKPTPSITRAISSPDRRPRPPWSGWQHITPTSAAAFPATTHRSSPGTPATGTPRRQGRRRPTSRGAIHPKRCPDQSGSRPHRRPLHGNLYLGRAPHRTKAAEDARTCVTTPALPLTHYPRCVTNLDFATSLGPGCGSRRGDSVRSRGLVDHGPAVQGQGADSAAPLLDAPPAAVTSGPVLGEWMPHRSLVSWLRGTGGAAVRAGRGWLWRHRPCPRRCPPRRTRRSHRAASPRHAR